MLVQVFSERFFFLNINGWNKKYRIKDYSKRPSLLKTSGLSGSPKESFQLERSGHERTAVL